MSYQKFGVIGGGAWGTALATALQRAGREVLIWAYEPECRDSINERHENELYLKGVKLHEDIRATSDLADLGACDAVLAVPPAQHMRRTLSAFAPHAKDGLPIILCSKGIEHNTLSFMAGVLEDTIPDAQAAVLSGPSFAIDVANGLPAAVTLACADEKLGRELIEAIGSPTFRPYLTHDIIGSEIGGAVKNVLAIACGMVLGKGLGKSAHAAIIARGYREMTRLGTALGADAETLTGLCGLGDLVLTCSSEQSRNMSCGLALGRGQALADILASRNAVTEGVATAPALKQLAANHDVDMPICLAVSDILDGSVSVDQAMMRLLSRERKMETE